MSLTPGAKLGPYEILTPLGAGGIGEVYKARDTRLDRTVAIKILPETLAADPQFRERFDREARTVSALDHPHICALYDVGKQDGTSFLVMQARPLATSRHCSRCHTRGPSPNGRASSMPMLMSSGTSRFAETWQRTTLYNAQSEPCQSRSPIAYWPQPT
jgi:serine/threonine protein kinase